MCMCCCFNRWLRSAAHYNDCFVPVCNLPEHGLVSFLAVFISKFRSVCTHP